MVHHSFKVGDKVVFDVAQVPSRFWGTVYVITALARVNVIVEPVGGGAKVRVKPGALLPAPDGAEGGSPLGHAVVVPLPAPQLPVGTVVTVAGPRWKGGTGFFVVIRGTRETASIAVLGGDHHRYWKSIPRSWLTPVDPGPVATALAAIPR